jgi:mono/diheme cytochrome c family protein
MTGPAAAGLLLLASALPIVSGGSEARGIAIFEKRCAHCHSAARLAGKGARVERDLSRIDRAMRPVGLLSDVEVADLAAYLDGVRDHEDHNDR